VGPLQIVLPGLGCGTNLAARSRNSVGTEPSLHGLLFSVSQGAQEVASRGAGCLSCIQDATRRRKRPVWNHS